jgi:hypothetical protein
MFHRRASSKKIMRKWRTSLETIKRGKCVATHALYFFVARRALLHWQRRLKSALKQKRNETLGRLLQKRDKATLTSHFNYWRSNAAALLRIEITAVEVRRRKEEDIVSGVFASWLWRTRLLVSFERRSADFERSTRLR